MQTWPVSQTNFAIAAKDLKDPKERGKLFCLIVWACSFPKAGSIFCVLCTAITTFHSFSRGFLGCHFGKLVYVAVACGKQSGDDSLSGFCELVTMSAGDFLQDSMSTQQCQAAGDGGRLAKS